MKIELTKDELLAILCTLHHFITRADSSYHVSSWNLRTGETIEVLSYQDVCGLISSIRDKIEEVLNA